VASLARTISVKHLCSIADGEAEPAEAVRSNHAELGKLKITRHRLLDNELQANTGRGAIQQGNRMQ
jgi:hypothetical protein